MNDVYPNDLIEKAAEELKKVEAVKPPVWAQFVKTGVHKERAPADKEWWYKRAAAVLRSIQILGPIGVSKLRIKYGGKQRRGHQPPVFKKGSGSIIRKVLQQLDKAGFTKFSEKGVHKGRVITKQGKLFLNKVTESILKTRPVKEEKSEVAPPVEKEKLPEKKEEKTQQKKETPKVPEKKTEEKPKKQ